MADFLIFSDNGGGQNQRYHDVMGASYDYPSAYKYLITPGSKIIYYKKKKTASDPADPTRRTDESHYCGTAEVTAVSGPNQYGNYTATITNYSPFLYPVMLHQPNGDYYESAANRNRNVFRNGVRQITRADYDNIVLASAVKPPTPSATPKPSSKPKTRKQGIRTFTNVAALIDSNKFNLSGQQDLQIVATSGAKGKYYLYRPSNGLYYELIDTVKPVVPTDRLRILNGNASGDCLLLHNQQSVGYLKSIPTGIRFTPLSGHPIDIYF